MYILLTAQISCLGKIALLNKINLNLPLSGGLDNRGVRGSLKCDESHFLVIRASSVISVKSRQVGEISQVFRAIYGTRVTNKACA